MIDPVAKLGKGDGGDLLARYAVELLAVALDESERRESITINLIESTRVCAVILFCFELFLGRPETKAQYGVAGC